MQNYHASVSGLTSSGCGCRGCGSRDRILSGRLRGDFSGPRSCPIHGSCRGLRSRFDSCVSRSTLRTLPWRPLAFCLLVFILCSTPKNSVPICKQSVLLAAVDAPLILHSPQMLYMQTS